MKLVDLRDIGSLPVLMSVPQAADVLGISVSAAYRSVATNRRTDGAKGLPHIALVGNRIAIPSARLLRLAGVDYSFEITLTDNEDDDDQDDLTSDGWSA